jgi:alpha-L-rhamnosidase
MGVTKRIGRSGHHQLKAAKDSRTPKPCGGSSVRVSAPASWSAAVLCRFVLIVVTFAVNSQAGFAAESQIALPPEFQWPAPSRENRPWTRWWWLGSAVDKTNLTRLLTEYREAGIGGIEICPIYGAKGYEDRFIDFLSPKWMEMFAHTAAECKRLGLGLDLTTGTGWPFGGPNVNPEIASGKVVLKRYDVAGGEQFKTDLPQGQLQCLMAYSDKNEQLNLTDKVAGRHLDWAAPAGKWRLYAVLESSPAQKVKRAAPGGEGNVLDPYSVKALDQYLTRFDKAFADYHGEKPRSWFHDSFEYYGAQWTPDFFREFEARRGYDLRMQLPVLFGEGPEDTVARVKSDYRETISDLHLAYIERWTEWCHAHGSISRDQAHGSPGNLVDIYGAADIPETEIFGSVEEKHIPMNKFSSSAAHIAGRKYASSESFTWLTEHFQASLSNIKQAADYLFLSGVNHIFFHGIPYSPAEAPWPGWQFYAAVNFGPQGGLWRDLPEFNAYITRCQSFLQSGAPDNDVLVYYPIYDVWHDPGELIRPNPVPKSLTNVVMTLWEKGYSFDYVSDRFLAKAECKDHKILLGGNEYNAVVVPECQLMPATTLSRLIQLANDGGSIIFQKRLPTDVPGLGNLERRRATLREIQAHANWTNTQYAGRYSQIGNGRLLVAPTVSPATELLEVSLASWGIRGELSVRQAGIGFIRRKYKDGFIYFFANRTERALDRYVQLETRLRSAVIFDGRFESRIGVAKIFAAAESEGAIHLQLNPGESYIVRTFTNKVVEGPSWAYVTNAGPTVPIAGTWKVYFSEGEPQISQSVEIGELKSWTELGISDLKLFAGTGRYTITFDGPQANPDDWMLDLGKVCESARVKLNGHQLGALWCAPFRETVGEWLKPGKNTLEVEVTNLAANRIADLDRRKVKWKYFYDINVASKRYRSLDASEWPLFDSGLLGPVTLTPLKKTAVN